MCNILICPFYQVLEEQKKAGKPGDILKDLLDRVRKIEEEKKEEKNKNAEVVTEPVTINIKTKTPTQKAWNFNKKKK